MQEVYHFYFTDNSMDSREEKRRGRAKCTISDTDAGHYARCSGEISVTC